MNFIMNFIENSSSDTCEQQIILPLHQRYFYRKYLAWCLKMVDEGGSKPLKYVRVVINIVLNLMSSVYDT